MSSIPDLVARVLRPSASGGSPSFDGRVDVDEARGLQVFDGRGARVESIDALLLAVGDRPAWRRPVVAGTPLSERELLVERRVAEGRGTAEIAAELAVSLRTVTTLRRRLNDRGATALASSGSAGVAIIGAAGITRDLVRACLLSHRSDVGHGGVAHLDDIVRVLVTPSARDFRIAGRARLVIVGALAPDFSVLEAVRCGAVGFIPVATSEVELVTAVQRAADATVTVPDVMVQRLIEAIRDERAVDVAPLTERDVDVVEGIRLGESVKQTARRLGLSPKTIENRRHQLFERYGVRSAAALVRALSDVGLISDQASPPS